MQGNVEDLCKGVKRLHTDQVSTPSDSPHKPLALHTHSQYLDSSLEYFNSIGSGITTTATATVIDTVHANTERHLPPSQQLDVDGQANDWDYIEANKLLRDLHFDRIGRQQHQKYQQLDHGV